MPRDPFFIQRFDHWSSSPAGLDAKLAQLADEKILRQQFTDLFAEVERMPTPFEMSLAAIDADYAEMLRLTAEVA